VEVMRLLSEINARGTTVVVATHDMNMVREMGRRTLVLKAGRVLEEIPEVATARWKPALRPAPQDVTI